MELTLSTQDSVGSVESVDSVDSLGSHDSVDDAAADRAPPTTAWARLQRQAWLFLDEPSSSAAAKVWSSFMMLTILLSIASFTFASVPANMRWADAWVNLTSGEVVPGSTRAEARETDAFYLSDSPRFVSDEIAEDVTPYREIETFCIACFTAEYLGRLLASPQGPGPRAYLLNVANTIDLVSILPFYVELVLSALPGGSSSAGDLEVLAVLRLIRLTRITRVFKLGKLGKSSKSLEGLLVLLRTLKESLAALALIFVIIALVSIFFATMIFTFEGGDYDPYRQQYVRDDGSPTPFESIPGSLWWAIITMTTVGYGDQYPVTTAGKLLAVVCMFIGTIMLALPITIVGANFDAEFRRLRKREHERAEAKRDAKRKARGARARLGSAPSPLGASGVSPQASLMASSRQPPPTGPGRAHLASCMPPPLGGKGRAPSGDQSAPARAEPPEPDGAPDGGSPPRAGTRRGATQAGAEVAAGASGARAADGVADGVPVPGVPDPIRIIVDMIQDEHVALEHQVELLMAEHEDRLRAQIKAVLQSYADLPDAETSLDRKRAVSSRAPPVAEERPEAKRLRELAAACAGGDAGQGAGGERV